jgi:hypothetical protein
MFFGTLVQETRVRSMSKNIRVSILDDHQGIIDGYLFRLSGHAQIEVVAMLAYTEELEPALESVSYAMAQAEVLPCRCPPPSSPKRSGRAGPVLRCNTIGAVLLPPCRRTVRNQDETPLIKGVSSLIVCCHFCQCLPHTSFAILRLSILYSACILYREFCTISQPNSR